MAQHKTRTIDEVQLGSLTLHNHNQIFEWIIGYQGATMQGLVRLLS